MQRSQAVISADAVYGPVSTISHRQRNDQGMVASTASKEDESAQKNAQPVLIAYGKTKTVNMPMNIHSHCSCY